MTSRAEPAPTRPPHALLRLLQSLLLALPGAIILRLVDASPLWLFLVSSVAIIPLAGLMGRATESLAESLGPSVGGLLNATFGNAAELIIALMALIRAGANPQTLPEMHALVHASITGSIIGNILLVLGASILAGGFFHKRQVFNRSAATMAATLLTMASIGLLIPSLYSFLVGPRHGKPVIAQLSQEIAGILLLVYLLSMVFSLRTHKHLYAGLPGELPLPAGSPRWSRRTALLVLLAATAGVALMSEFLVASVESAGEALGLSAVFIGVIVVGVIGNAAEHSTAVLMAVRNKMDLAFHIAVSSSLQIALFVAPVLVFASLLLGHTPALDLEFTPLELVAVIAAIAVLALVSQDGESHWLEGVLLLAIYLILALAFYHLPGKR